MTLYAIAQDVQALEEMLFELGGDISDTEIEAAFDQWFAEIGEAVDRKLNNYGLLMRELEARAQARKDEAKRLASLAATDRNAVERLKKRLKWFMESTGKTTLETANFKFAIVANGGGLPLIVNPAWVTDPASAPEQFHKIKVELDTKAIREALRNDEPAEGCAIGARGTHLRVR